IPEQWTIIREKIAALERQVPASRGLGSIARSDAPAPESHAAVAPPAGEKMPDAPKIAIASRVFKAGTVRVKGYLEGTDLKSAGIFDGDIKSKEIDVAAAPGEQRINFDFSIEQPSPTQSIRVTDSDLISSRREFSTATSRAKRSTSRLPPASSESTSISRLSSLLRRSRFA